MKERDPQPGEPSVGKTGGCCSLDMSSTLVAGWFFSLSWSTRGVGSVMPTIDAETCSLAVGFDDDPRPCLLFRIHRAGRVISQPAFGIYNIAAYSPNPAEAIDFSIANFMSIFHSRSSPILGMVITRETHQTISCAVHHPLWWSTVGGIFFEMIWAMVVIHLQNYRGFCELTHFRLYPYHQEQPHLRCCGSMIKEWSALEVWVRWLRHVMIYDQPWTAGVPTSSIMAPRGFTTAWWDSTLTPPSAASVAKTDALAGKKNQALKQRGEDAADIWGCP